MLDLVIRDALLVDGTGSEPVQGDIGVADGRIVAMGRVEERGTKTVGADGRVVCPGFIDVHTHFDAQVFWDPYLSPSPQHGVTSAVAGNCGFSIAPLSPAAAPYLMRMLSRVEGMPLESLTEGVPWDWTATSDYLERCEGNLAINLGFMVGHSAIRRVVMGEAANERSADPQELAAMCTLLREGLAAGGFGFSSTNSESHSDLDGRPVPSRFADRDEFLTLARVCGEFEGTSLEMLPRGLGRMDGAFDDDVVDLMITMSREARRPLNWNPIIPTASDLETIEARLAMTDQAAARGAKIVGLTFPIDHFVRFSFYHSAAIFDLLEGWAPVLALPLDARLQALRDPEIRARMRAGAERTPNMAHLTRWDTLVIVETHTPETASFTGRVVGDIAREQGKDPFDALLDVVVADGLRTSFSRRHGGPPEADWAARFKVVDDPRTVVGASDAGAHLDRSTTFRYSTGLLEEYVRNRGLLSPERAIHLLTGAPARLYGFRDRGVLALGAHADLLVVDLDRIAAGEVTTVFDLPAGAGRLYSEPEGIDHVVVAGTEIIEDGQLTRAVPGRVLRAGVDTTTPTLAV
jgi:N-acyl-D-aspartate/D-glutamate deacylase